LNWYQKFDPTTDKNTFQNAFRIVLQKQLLLKLLGASPIGLAFAFLKQKQAQKQKLSGVRANDILGSGPHVVKKNLQWNRLSRAKCRKE
jgi:hypothetical protein